MRAEETIRKEMTKLALMYQSQLSPQYRASLLLQIQCLQWVSENDPAPPAEKTDKKTEKK